MKLIVGLGNPGKQYQGTRHNIGFRAVDRLAERLGVEFSRKLFRGWYGEGALPEAHSGPEAGDGRLMLAKPQTFMNCSGETVQGLLGYFKIERRGLLVVVDDVALPLGSLRLRTAGSSGGHNGLGDIEARLGSQAYARLRIGVGGREAGGAQPVEALTGHVLGRFQPQEEKVVLAALEQAAEACLTWAGRGAEEAMQKYNSTGKGDGQ